jgi:beta-galactosidase
MKHTYKVLACIMLIFSQAVAQPQTNSLMNFDSSWKFHLGGALRAESVDFNDSNWRKVDLPHDWSIEDRPGTHSPFNPDAISQVNEGFTVQGTGWYRKDFTVPASAKGKRVIIQFDGVYMNSDIYVNGQHVGNHPYGYTSFYYDITKELKFGETNVIAVEVKNEGQNSRWYSGSGIYRHVWLKTVDPVHLKTWGTYITTRGADAAAAKVVVKNKIVNESTGPVVLKVITRILSARGREVGKIESSLSIPAGEERETNEQAAIKRPQLWSCETPVMYKAVTEIYKSGKMVDSEKLWFGIRQISFTANNGFQLNGKTMKLKGGCFHIDNGPLGSKAYDRAEERKVELLKASGFNAIRCSHNPPSPAFLDACDRLGVLIIDEAFDMWIYGNNAYDYHLYFKDWWQKDMESMVTRDRNHPSVILWSIGNEIPQMATPEGVETAHKLADYVRGMDPGRPVTAAVNDLNPGKDAFFAALDVCGYNYAINHDDHQPDLYAQDHKRLPERVMFATESFPLKAFNAWMAVLDHPYVVGDFVWTGWDYIGEASIGWLGYPQKSNFYPWNLAFCGDIDICGGKRPQSFYRDALWKNNQLSIFVKPPTPSFKESPDKSPWSIWNWVDVVPQWNWEGFENKPLEVSVYSSCDKVELFLNGRSLGVKQTGKTEKFMATWTVPYQAGKLKAVGYSSEKPVKTAALETAGKPLNIRLSADRVHLGADSQDLSYITVDVVDANGLPNPEASDLISFELEGDATIAGVGNANPMSLESYQLPQRSAWKGKCMVILKAGKKGKVTLKATAAGLKSSEINLVVD